MKTREEMLEHFRAYQRMVDGIHEGRIQRGEWFKDCPTVRRFIDRYGYPWPEGNEWTLV